LNKKQKQILGIIFLNFLIICIFLSTNVSAQAFDLQISEDNEYLWEVKEINADKFEFTFDAEPNFIVGDKKKMVILDITETEASYRWTLTVAFWDFGVDWIDEGDTQYLSVIMDPADYEQTIYNDGLFVPSPVDDYFETAIETLPSDYYFKPPFTIGRQWRSDSGVLYKREKTFEASGVLFQEIWYDSGDSVIVKMERIGFIIPFGFSFAGYMALATIALMGVFIGKKKWKIK
jgi:hypothetical protein